MKLLTKAYVLANKKQIIEDMISGKIFIYPTDTIYGIGCNALNEEAVAKIRSIKKRDNKPFSIVVPSFEWIHQNCIATQAGKIWIGKLPGPYTLILPLKNQNAVAKSVILSSPSIGIRIPNNWFYELIKEINIPFVTTSANISGKYYMTDFYNLDENIKQEVDYIIYEGALEKKPSMVVKLSDNKEEILKR